MPRRLRGWAVPGDRPFVCWACYPHAPVTRLMAFRLRPDESVSRGLRRLARDELQSARTELRNRRIRRDDAVHEARKSVKKVRAILELMDEDGGHGLDRCEKRLRSVNGMLSEL